MIVECPKLSSPRYGRMDNDLVNEGTMEIATFNCFKGYHLLGASALYCEDGYWSGRVPQCIRKSTHIYTQLHSHACSI